MLRYRAGIGLDLFLQQLDRRLELCVISGKRGMRQVVDDDVRIDTVAFDKPLPFGTVYSGFGGGGDTVVGLDVAALSQISPPHVRMPITLPSPRRRNPSVNASPSEAVC